MRLLALPAFADNYIWLLHDPLGNALVVDPGESAPVEQALSTHGLALRTILLTHHHPDHVGGAPALRDRHGARVIAPEDPRIEGADRRVHDGDTVELQAPAIRLRVLAVPGHTRSHVAYVGDGLLFCGDALFSLGCGRPFEGPPAQLLASLERLAALSPDCQVCCGHEYSATNGRFALGVDPGNAALQERVAQIREARDAGRPSVPVPLASERACNPFLRIDSPALVAWGQARGIDDRIERFAALRAAKDMFR